MTDDVDLEEVRNMVQIRHQQLSQMREWSGKQAADLRAKAEVLEELDIDPDEFEVFPGTAEGMRAVAGELDSLYARLVRGDSAVTD